MKAEFIGRVGFEESEASEVVRAVERTDIETAVDEIVNAARIIAGATI